MIESAISFVRRGFHVFPLLSRLQNDKNKLGTPIGWNHNNPEDNRSIPSTTNEDEINEWPNKYPDMVGYAVNPRGRRAIILDVDVKDDKQGEDSLRRLISDFGITLDTLVVRSKSGGVHVYYDYEGIDKRYYVKGTKIENYPDIDLRTDNNFVVGPGPHCKYKIVRDFDLASIPLELQKRLPLGPLSNPCPSEPNRNIPTEVMTGNALVYDDSSMKGEIPEVIKKGERDNTLISLIGSWCRRALPRDTVIALTEVAISRCDQSKDPITIEEYIPKIDSTLAKTDFLSKTPDKLQWMIDHLVYVMDQNVVYDESTRKVSVMRNAENKFANFIVFNETPSGKTSKLKCFPMWMESSKRKAVDSFGYHPVDKVFVYDNVQEAEVVNIYRAPFGKDYKPEPWSDSIDTHPGELFEEFCNWLFGEHATFMLDWAAHQIQSPHQKLGIAPIMLSRARGVGKNLFYDLVRSCIGNHNATDADVTEVVDKFCEFSMKHHMVLINETNIDSRDRSSKAFRNNVMERLKAKITESKQTVEPKYICRFNAQSYINYIIATNNIDAVPIEPNDRRFHVVEIMVTKQPHKFYAPLWGIVENRSQAWWLRDYLMKREITHVRKGMTIDTVTLAKHRMISAYKDSEDHEIDVFVEDRVSVFRSEVITLEIFEWFIRTKTYGGSKFASNTIKNMFEKKFVPILDGVRIRRALVPIPGRIIDGQYIPTEKKRCTLYSTRNHGKMNTASASWIRAQYILSLDATEHGYKDEIYERSETEL